ncbi:hypothetical protein MMC10_009862 [Thelotrema lepadinum]|nr:hypothetical protein [Thelotrema lepadinum]
MQHSRQNLGRDRSPGSHDTIKIEAPDSSLDQASIDILYLRDSCSCPRCVNPSTQQKLFETSELPLDIAAQDYRWLPDGSLEVLWENDIQGMEGHRSVFSHAFLSEQLRNPDQRLRASGSLWDHVAWDKAALEKEAGALRFQYDDFISHDRTLRQLVDRLHTFGLGFVTGVPCESGALKVLAQRIGPLRHTFYGETWDVKSKSSPINVAYTADELDFHMDLLYMADPPYIQMLHCIKQSTRGGESRFADGVRAFDKFQHAYPHLVRHLTDFPVTYQYKNDGHSLRRTRRFLDGGGLTYPMESNISGQELQYLIDYESINWSPPFQGPFEQAKFRNSSGRTTTIRDYIEAAKTFKKLLADESAVYETKLEEGTCVIFNNRRVLHARQPFHTEGGERWLKGCYIDGDYLRDRYRILSKLDSGN